VRLFFLEFFAYFAGKKDAGVVQKFQQSDSKPTQQFPYADNLRQRARTVCRQITQEYRGRISAPRAEFRRLKEWNNDDALTEATAEVGRANKRLDDARNQPRDPSDQKPVLAFFSRPIYLVVMIGLAIVEIPFNVMVMQVISENFVLIAIVAVGISVLAPLFGHVIGKQVRAKDYIKATVTGGVVVFLPVVLAYFRALYLSESSGRPPDAKVAIAFFLIGFVFLTLTSVVSLYSEPGEDEYAPREIVAAKGDLRRRKRELEKCRSDASRIKERIDSADEKGRRLRDERDAEVEREIRGHNRILNAYWRGFHKAWKGPEYPDGADFDVGKADEPQLWPPDQAPSFGVGNV